MQEKELLNIIELLETLTIQQDELITKFQETQEDIKQIKAQINNLETKPAAAPKASPKAASTKPTYKVGDRVKIKNPRSGQEPKAVVIGYNKLGWPKICTDAGETTTRISGNLELDEDYN